MTSSHALRDNRAATPWRWAVWGLRIMGPGLATVAAGLFTLAWSTSSGLSILSVGMCVYLVGVVITVTGILVIYVVVSPRPNFIEVRWSLLHDAVHIRDHSPNTRRDIRDHSTEASSSSSVIATLRSSEHWRWAVWSVRAIVPILAVVIAGLVTLVWSRTVGRVVVASSFGVYAVGVGVSFLEVHFAYRGLPSPRPTYAHVRRTLMHDALHVHNDQPNSTLGG